MEKSANYIVTRHGRESWKIVCHNFKPHNHRYYLMEENQIQIQDLETFSDDNRPLELCLTLNNLPNGIYQIRTREIHRASGSVQNIWQRMNMESDLDREDLDYIRRMCIPQLLRESVTVEDGSLTCRVTVRPNEIKYLHIVLRRS